MLTYQKMCLVLVLLTTTIVTEPSVLPSKDGEIVNSAVEDIAAVVSRPTLDDNREAAVIPVSRLSATTSEGEKLRLNLRLWVKKTLSDDALILGKERQILFQDNVKGIGDCAVISVTSGTQAVTLTVLRDIAIVQIQDSARSFSFGERAAVLSVAKQYVRNIGVLEDWLDTRPVTRDWETLKYRESSDIILKSERERLKDSMHVAFAQIALVDGSVVIWFPKRGLDSRFTFNPVDRFGWFDGKWVMSADVLTP